MRRQIVALTFVALPMAVALAAGTASTADLKVRTTSGRDYYLKTDSRSEEIRTKYVDHIAKIFGLAGEPAGQAAADATTVMGIETAMATASLDRVKRRDPAMTQHRMTITELQALTPTFNWRKYATAALAPPLPTINVSVPDYLRALDHLIASTKIGDLKAYLRWHLLHRSAGLGWAQVWCENTRPEAERLKAATNPHSSNTYGVNGPMSNMPEFQKAFSCKAGASMVRPNACRVW